MNEFILAGGIGVVGLVTGYLLSNLVIRPLTSTAGAGCAVSDALSVFPISACSPSRVSRCPRSASMVGLWAATTPWLSSMAAVNSRPCVASDRPGWGRRAQAGSGLSLSLREGRFWCSQLPSSCRTCWRKRGTASAASRG